MRSPPGDPTLGGWGQAGVGIQGLPVPAWMRVSRMSMPCPVAGSSAKRADPNHSVSTNSSAAVAKSGDMNKL